MADEFGKPGLNINATEFRPNPNAPSFTPGASWTVPKQNQPIPNLNPGPIEPPPEEPVESWDDGLEDEPGPPAAIVPETSSKHSAHPPGETVNAPSTSARLEQAVGNNVAPPVVAPNPAQPIEEPHAPAEEEVAQPIVNGVKSPGPEEADDWSEEDPMDEVPPAVRKKALSEQGAPKKEYVNVIFIGHVDAGKSTIGGQIMFLTGMVDKRTLEKYEREAKEKNRESWYLSWALDTNQEERDKGKTVEVGRAFFETEKRHFTILDAPGHKSFVPNMIGGASQADLAVLVISARRGEFETGFDRGGQTREHAMLVKTVGVKFLIILVNKMDDPTVGWSEERFNECKDKLVPYLKTIGFNPKTDFIFIPCSGLTGAFLKEPIEPQCPWYTGPSFIQYLDEMATFGRSSEGPVRIPLVDKYNDMGTVVLGKVESGSVSKGQTLTLMPNRVSVQVLQLWSDDDETDEIVSGENVKIKLKGVDEGDILPGFVLCSNDDVCHTGRLFDAQVMVQEHKSIIAAGYSCVMHIHNAVEEVEVKSIICLIDIKTKEKKRARFVKQGQLCIMKLEAPEVFCLETYKAFAKMGRFTLRDEGKTIAFGKVLKVCE